MNILIIGAGPCGLGAAYHLEKLGHHDWEITERNGHVGGLSASFTDESGFTWDVGGHVLFSHFDYFDGAVSEALAGAYYEHQRESWVRILQTWVPYPFQNNVRYLPEAALKECVEGLRNLRGEPARAENFLEWMDTVFGSGIVKYFMEPYNRKVWGVPLESMSKEWIAERVSVIDLARIEQNIAQRRDDLSWGPNNTFKFPEKGGTGAIFEGIARPMRPRINLDEELVSLHLQKKEARFSSGKTRHYDMLVNTSPLDELITRCVDATDAVREAASRLTHNSGLIVGAGFRGHRADPKCWMYFPENNSPFYRVTNFHNYSPFNVPGGKGACYSLMCETTYSPWKPENKERIVEDTLAGLEASGLLLPSQREDLVSTFTIDIPYSYPVPTLERDSALDVIQPFLESVGVYSRGRFGAWRYEVGNMDHSFMQGVEVVDKILINKPETMARG